jgi:hypothetical protein
LSTFVSGFASAASARPLPSDAPQQRSFSGIPTRRERQEHQERRQQIRNRLACNRQRPARSDAEQHDYGRTRKQPTPSQSDAAGQNDTTK